MRRHSIPVEGLLEALDSWVECVQNDKPDLARTDAERLHIFGRLLAEDREFQELFRCNLSPCVEREPGRALQCMFAFMIAVAETTRPGAFRADHLWQDKSRDEAA